jgi:hypothetical protein
LLQLNARLPDTTRRSTGGNYCRMIGTHTFFWGERKRD